MPIRSLLTATALLAATAGYAADDGHDDHSDHLAELDGLRALHAWTRATDAGKALVFVELENTSDTAIVLEGAEHEAAGGVALVGFMLKNGETHYEPLPAMPIQPGRTLHLEPDGVAIRLDGLPGALARGDSFEMHLLTNLGELEIVVEVEAADATRHSHAGHNH